MKTPTDDTASGKSLSLVTLTFNSTHVDRLSLSQVAKEQKVTRLVDSVNRALPFFQHITRNFNGKFSLGNEPEFASHRPAHSQQTLMIKNGPVFGDDNQDTDCCPFAVYYYQERREFVL